MTEPKLPDPFAPTRGLIVALAIQAALTAVALAII